MQLEQQDLHTQHIKPNFFLVGAPKCGTTSVYNALIQHPEIYLPKQKELHYFSPDLYPSGYITSEQYHGLFNKVMDEKIIGEASVWYLYSDQAPRLIKEYNPDSKILIMLRNPVEMISSLHSQFVFDNIETYEILEDALLVETDRRKGNKIPSTIYSKKMLYYVELGRYFKYVNNYFNVFNCENIHVITLEDLRDKPEEIYRDLFKFLRVSDHQNIKLKKFNTRKTPRFKLISKIINPDRNVKSVIRKLIPFTFRRKLIEILINFNSNIITPDKLDYKLRIKLEGLFLEDINKLSKLINKDLNGWIN